MGKKKRSKTSGNSKIKGPDSSNISNHLHYLKKYTRKRWILAILVFAFSFLVYIPSLGNDFVWDDVINIKKQSYKFEGKSIIKNIIPKDRENRKKGYYRPVINSSIVIDYYFWGDNPFGYHLTNNLLFSLSSLLFFFLILLILKDFHIGSKEYIAGIATVIYIIHPMHVESVSWMAGRSDIICSLFFIAAFIFHILSYRSILFFPLTLLMLALSFLSKEIAVAFPVVVLCYDLLKSKEIKLKNLYFSLIYFVFLAVYLAVRGRALVNVPGFSALTIRVPEDSSADLGHYLKSLVIVLNSYFVYFLKTVFPFKFSAFISDVPRQAAYTIFSAAVFTALAVWSFVSIRYKTGLKAFAILWFVLTLGPSVLVAILQVATTPLAERYLFLPICGFSLLVAYLVFPYLQKDRSGKFHLVFLLMCILLLYFNISRQAVWSDRVSFWNDISEKSKDSAAAAINRGIALIENNKIDEGLKVLESVFQYDNNASLRLKTIAANNIGVGYLNKNKPEIARKWFLKGVELDPDFHKSYFHLALIDFSYAARNNSPELYKKAELNLQKALSIDSRYSRAYLLLAKIYSRYNDSGKAKEYARKSLQVGLEKSLHPQAMEIINR